MPLSFKGKQYPSSIILQAIRYYLAYPLSFRDIEDIFKERGLGMEKWIPMVGHIS
ncbi:hypothetical protein [Enterovibrio nigricans]|uniref:hypothetical protein n=1 Tax=Enterovibrio nigricans TaxID=504469 RepID=UPI0012FEC657